MENILNNLTMPQMKGIVRKLNIRERIPRFTKITKQALITELSKHVELVEVNGDLQFKAKDDS